MTRLVKTGLVLCLWMFSPQPPETYVVILIKGQAKRPGKPLLAVGDRLSSKDTVVLHTAADFLLVINTKGTYRVALPDHQVTSTEWFRLLVKDKLPFFPEGQRLGSKGIQGMQFYDWIRTMELINNHIALPDTMKVAVRDPSLPFVDNNSTFFFLQLARGERLLNRKLTVLKDTLFLCRQDFIFEDTLYNDSSGLLSLGLAEDDAGNRRVRLITDLKPSFISREQLALFVRAVKVAFPTASRQELREVIYTDLYYIYGKPDAVMPVVEGML